MKMAHQQADQRSANDKKLVEGQETHFPQVDHLPLESDKQPIEGVRADRFHYIFTMADLAEIPGTV